MEAPIDQGGIDVEGFSAMLVGSHHSTMSTKILQKVDEAMARAGRFMQTLQGFRWETFHSISQ